MILSYIYIKDIEKSPRREARQLQSRAARRLLEDMLDFCGIAEREVARDDKGRPYLVDRPDVDFNISHADNIAVCVLSLGEGRVGVDVEKIDHGMTEERLERFAKRFFLYNIPTNARELTKKWTAKEAYLKYLGVGLTSGIYSVTPEDDEKVRIEQMEIGDCCLSVCLGKDKSLSVVYPINRGRE